MRDEGRGFGPFPACEEQTFVAQPGLVTYFQPGRDECGHCRDRVRLSDSEEVLFRVPDALARRATPTAVVSDREGDGQGVRRMWTKSWVAGKASGLSQTHVVQSSYNRGVDTLLCTPSDDAVAPRLWSSAFPYPPHCAPRPIREPLDALLPCPHAALCCPGPRATALLPTSGATTPAGPPTPFP